MSSEIRITRKLYETVQEDLLRSHQFAHERVGFLFTRLSQSDSHHPLIFIHRYISVPDEWYLPSDEFGAAIGSEAIQCAMQEVRSGRDAGEGVFHVHIHGHRGQPGLSGPDRRSLPNLIPSFQRMGPTAAHGIIILSNDHGAAWVWLPGQEAPTMADRIVVVGPPTGIFTRKKK